MRIMNTKSVYTVNRYMYNYAPVKFATVKYIKKTLSIIKSNVKYLHVLTLSDGYN